MNEPNVDPTSPQNEPEKPKYGQLYFSIDVYTEPDHKKKWTQHRRIFDDTRTIARFKWLHLVGGYPPELFFDRRHPDSSTFEIMGLMIHNAQQNGQLLLRIGSN